MIKMSRVLNRLIDLRDFGEQRVVQLKANPRRIDFLRETCGLNAKSRSVETLENKKADNYVETLLSANEATALRSSTTRSAFVAADIAVFTCGEQDCETHGTAHGWRVEPTGTTCARDSWSWA